MKILFVGHREWAKKIYNDIENNYDCESLYIASNQDLTLDSVKAFNPDLILFYGWSWMVEEQIINHYTSLMLHPSPLPKYRGGSPIQNQIINGETKSAVSIFIMNEDLDAGPICRQEEISLDGNLDDIIERIIVSGTKLTLDILTNGLNPYEQDHKTATYYETRKPCQSEITIDELKTQSAKYLYNKIRMLQDPYPNAYIVGKDGKKLYIKEAVLDEAL